MKLLNQHFIGTMRSVWGALLISSITGFARLSYAQLYTLTDGNSSFQYDATSGAVGWMVDGVNQLKKQAFFYRVGGSGGEQLVSAINSTPTVTTNDARHLDVVYANSDYQVAIHYVLSGNLPGSYGSGLQASLSVNNLSASTLNFSFFQYSDFDLGGVLDNQSGVITKGTAGYYNRVGQTLGSLFMTNTLSATRINAASLVGIATDGSILASLLDGNPTSLSNTETAGLGNVAYAIQWNYALAAFGTSGDTLGISESFSLNVPPSGIPPVPEPSVLALALPCAIGLLLRRRMSNARN